MVDYLIVGGGIAGFCFAELCLQNKKSFKLITDDSQNSSKIAGGLYNPVILKRFSSLEDAEAHLNYLDEFYDVIQKRLEVQINFPLPLLRKFFSIEEQNNWFQAADEPKLSPFLSTIIEKKIISGIDAPFNYGKVLRTGYVDTALFVSKYQEYLKERDLIWNDTFQYSELVMDKNYFNYKGVEARKIVFAEGFGIHANPYFNYLPLDGTKG